MDNTDHTPEPLQVHIIDSLATVDAVQWNVLGGDKEPFLSHEFLGALERNRCLSEEFGWYPRHLLIRDSNGVLLGAMPMYIKTNSYGEFVFDWSWASAYERSGLDYYPKLVTAVPYTPVSGPRLLTHPDTHADVDAKLIKQIMAQQAIKYATDQQFSGMHWLFTTDEDTQVLKDLKLPLRMGCQYHWHNNGYENFDQFMEAFSSRKRKKVKRERRRVTEQGIKLRIVHGNEVDELLWNKVHYFYASTFDKKSGIPTLTLDFFKDIGQHMGEKIVLVLAEHEQRLVACAINFRSHDSLYGRFWGCDDDFHSLHFETCYYQGIDYCIQQGLKRFEPGAQGEHKIGRGFLPTRTWSAHWIANDEFRGVITDFCQREQRAMEHECEALKDLSPFRDDAIPPTHTVFTDN